MKHTGYVLQLAVPYYEELTVRQNLLLAAFMRLQRSISEDERFERVEGVIAQARHKTYRFVLVCIVSVRVRVRVSRMCHGLTQRVVGSAVAC